MDRTDHPHMIENEQSPQALLEQRRARQAWQAVLNAKVQDYGEKYGKLACSAGADIQANGLGPTLAFWKAKHEKHHEALLNDLTQWLKLELGIQQPTLLDWIMHQATTDQYRRLMGEALAYLVWVKRFAEAELGGD